MIQFPVSFFSTSSYQFVNSQAEAYFDALVANGFTPYVCENLYSLTHYSYSEALDNFFISGDNDGWLSRINILYLFQGNSAETQSINAINPSTYELTFINSPTYNKNGVTVDGATQYYKTGYIAGAVLANQNQMSMFGKLQSQSTTFFPYLSCIPSTSVRMQLGNSNVAGTFADAYNSTGTQGRLVITETKLTFNHYTRRTSIDAEMYVNGISTGISNTGGGTIPSSINQDLFGGVQNNGSGGPSANFGAGTVEIVGSGIEFSDAQALSLYNAYNTFATLIGR